MYATTGDKVRLKAKVASGQRGIVQAVRGRTLVVRLKDGQTVEAPVDDVLNFSLAARKAWVSGPNRRVGRPKGLKLCDRVSVTLRIDRDLWEQFRKHESTGAIEDRTATINRWLREKLARVHHRESAAQCPSA